MALSFVFGPYAATQLKTAISDKTSIYCTVLKRIPAGMFEMASITYGLLSNHSHSIPPFDVPALAPQRAPTSQTQS